MEVEEFLWGWKREISICWCQFKCQKMEEVDRAYIRAIFWKHIMTSGNYHRIISTLHVGYSMQIIKYYNIIISILPLKCFIFAFLRSRGVGYFFFFPLKSKPYSVTSVASLIPEQMIIYLFFWIKNKQYFATSVGDSLTYNIQLYMYNMHTTCGSWDLNLAH